MLDESLRSLSSRTERMSSILPQISNQPLTAAQLAEVRSFAFGAPGDAHLVGVCLRQLDEFTGSLVASDIWRGEVARKGKMFRDLVASTEVRDFRDVLEHSAKYIVGKGSKPELIVDPDGDYPSVLMLNGQAVGFAVFGRSYDIKNVVLAAIEFVKSLPSD